MRRGIGSKGGLIEPTPMEISTGDTKRKAFEPLCEPLAGREGYRFNDAATDFEGRFWVGTLNDANPKGPDGELFRIQRDGSYQLMDDNITVANGIGWSPNRKIMYFTDSFRYSIYAYDYVAATGTISNRRTFVQT